MNQAVGALMTQMPHTIGHDISVAKAKEMMTEFKCHHLPVLDVGHLVGVLSDRDVKVLNSFDNLETVKVEEIMSDEPIVVEPDVELNSVVLKMLEHGIHSVIVRAKGEKPWGIFTSTDALKHYVEN